jgi:hypothetical protein
MSGVGAVGAFARAALVRRLPVLDPGPSHGCVVTPSSLRKLAWAEHHLDTLDGEVRSFLERQPYTIVTKPGADHTRYEFIFDFEEHPFDRWSHIVGDVLANLRNALDHAVYELGVHEAGGNVPENGDRLMFPITRSLNDFRKVRWRIETLSDDAIDQIEALQPYHHPPGIDHSTIWHFSEGHNRDKHRSLRVTVAALHDATTLVEGLIPGQTATFSLDSVAPEMGAPFMHLALDRPNPNVKMHVNRASFQVLLLRGAPPDEGREGIPLLDFLHKATKDVAMFVRILGGFVGHLGSSTRKG